MESARKGHDMVKEWKLTTIKEDEGLGCFYERLGFRRTGIKKEIIEGMTEVEHRREGKG